MVARRPRDWLPGGAPWCTETMGRRDDGTGGGAPSIWWFALGYFACYVPYSATTKALTSDLLPGREPLSGFELLPPSVLASLVGMFAFLTAMRWWPYATQARLGRWSVPRPRPLTFISGLCTAVIIGTTTLAYTFDGASIVFMMLLMRGGVLVLAPVVDFVSGRPVRWFSWVALGLSLLALIVAFADDGSYALTAIAAVDVAAYLGGYFVRLKLMSGQAKSDDPAANKRFFVEEQMVATPAVLLALLAVAVLGGGEGIAGELRAGFTTFWGRAGVVPLALFVGLMSQGTGIFGGLILLDRRENSFCVPVNRSSSILAGLIASGILWAGLGASAPSGAQLVGAGLILAAIGALSLPPLLSKDR